MTNDQYSKVFLYFAFAGIAAMSIMSIQTEQFNPETAVQGNKVMQDFNLETAVEGNKLT